MRRVLSAAGVAIALAVAAGVVIVPLPSLGQTTYAAEMSKTAPATTESAVPVKQVVLFSSGVGYFEHGGTVKGDGATTLTFKAAQINDILKSLVLQDMDGGRVSVVSYPSQDPLAKTLKSFQVDLTANPSMAELLNQLRGAKVTLTSSGGDKIAGTVLGVETQTQAIGKDKDRVIEQPFVNMVTESGIKSVDLSTVKDVHLDDAALQAEMTRALAAMAGARDKDRKPVTIHFVGNGDRRVRLGYVIESPVWKTSYRLILPETETAKSKMQGWAIVENQTDSDWNDVQLSLVSGRPISFVQDLYTPLYVPRPTVVPELYASLVPQTYDEGIDAEGKPMEAFGVMRKSLALRDQVAQSRRLAPGQAGAPAAAPAMGGFGGGGQVAGESADRSFYAGAKVTPMDIAASVQSVANASKVGELFQYSVGNVTVARQSSSMLPIVNDDIEAEKVSIYNASVLQKNPLTGARLKNTTGKHLLGGPVTVLDGGTYGGDARIDNLPPGQERLISYGIDLQMLVHSENNKSIQSVTGGKIVRGVLQVVRKTIASQDYVAENKADAAKKLVIEHPLKPNWKLVEPAKADDTTDAVYRFNGTVNAGKTSKLTVKEETVQSEELALLGCDLPTMVYYSRTDQLPKDVRAALEEAAKRRQAVAATEQQINDRKARIGDYTAEQTRIRENLKSVSQSSQYYNRLMTKLNDQESALEKLQGEIDELQGKLNTQRDDLVSYLNNLTLG